MGFWKKLFQFKKNKIEDAENWAELVYARENVDVYDAEQRTRYVNSCLEQMAEASQELENVNYEYSLVTSYLTDIEEIEALPKEERDKIDKIAHALKALEQENIKYKDKKILISDEEYYQMRRQESEVEEGIKKLKEAEKYGTLIKQDLQRLNGELHAYDYRKIELESIMVNFKGMAIIFLTALVICLLMLVILQFGFEMDTYIGYFASILAGVLAIAVVCVKYIDADRELLRVTKAINKLIQLQNKVKIRYVNNINLLEYLYVKYNVEHSSKLEKKWKIFLQEKEERKQLAESEGKIDNYREQLLRQLMRYRVKTPERWVNQINGLVDKREMVETRHELIQRRQAIRKQMEYNNEVARVAKQEIMDLVTSYPEFAQEITNMVDEYEHQHNIT